MQLYDPRNIVVFRKIFRKHKNLCTSLLNCLLPLDEEKKIASLQYLEEDEVPDISKKRDLFMALRCTDVKGHNFLAEIHMFWVDFAVKYLLTNLSNAHKEKCMDHDWHDGVAVSKSNIPIYSLCLLNESMPKTIDIEGVIPTPRNCPSEFYQELRLGRYHFVLIELSKVKEFKGYLNLRAQLWLEFLTIGGYNPIAR